VLPHMVAILVAKWVADAVGKEGVYDLAQNVLGHPFLDLDHSIGYIQQADATKSAAKSSRKNSRSSKTEGSWMQV
jgi:hypothetical protein